MNEETEILAKTLYGEARSEGLSGIEAVANVVMNRVRHAQKAGGFWWGRSIKEVCLKPFQFSCWNPKDPNYSILNKDLSNDSLFDVCCRVAVRAIKGLLQDNTKGATHYHTLNVNPSWASKLTPCAQIGQHLFYDCV